MCGDGAAKEGGLGGWLARFLSNDASPLAQFIKYAIAGGVATATHIVTFFTIGFWLIPCVGQDDILVKLFRLTAPAMDDATRATRALICNVIAFVVSNLVCYLLNRLFVFKPGRHSALVEFLLFLAVSALSMSIGVSIQTWLIAHFGIQTTIAFFACTVTSLLINYVLRKFVVFKG
jgi:putative flippase GtrA